MLRTPYCLSCSNCMTGMRCDAYPDGIPTEVLHAKKIDGEICRDNIGFKRNKIYHQPIKVRWYFYTPN